MANKSGLMEILGWAICTLLLLSTLASLKGVYVAHFGVGGATFGSSNASLALVAFAINVTVFVKVLGCVLRMCDCCEKK